MQKVIKVDKKVIVMFEDGSYCERDDVSEELFKQIVDAQSDEEIYTLMVPEYEEKVRRYTDIIELKDSIKGSKFLTFRGESVYWDEVSQLSMPVELVKSVIDAETNGDELKLTTYKNFWILMSLNPDAECRKNLFWFLNRNGLTISKQGFFVAYRNVDTTSKPDVYTDHHSHTFKIKIGEMVTMPRDKCDCDSRNECSNGLHLASKHWLNMNYYGTVGLVCLCNPADVVAVPFNSQYGKLRTSAYLPIDKIEYGEDNHPIPYPAEDGFDCSYITKVIYEGLMGTEKDSTYRIEIPEIPGINKESISDKLLDIAMKCITDRQV